MNKKYVQYGCGASAPQEWTNFDASPTLRIQRTPIIGFLLRRKLNAVFPKNARYGDIVKGLPIPPDSCDGLFCSHVLEHLSLDDFRIALKNSYKVLKPEGIFRCIVPDLEHAARSYIAAVDAGNPNASVDFIGNNTLLGVRNRPKGLRGTLSSLSGNSMHLWMWDRLSLAEELRKCGFKDIRTASFGDCSDLHFRFVEEASRFHVAVAIECRK